MDKDVNNNHDWEGAWQQAFERANITPPTRVWQGIEHAQLNKQLHKYKRRAFWSQQMAAAAIVLLAVVSGYSVFNANRQAPNASVASVNVNTPGAGILPSAQSDKETALKLPNTANLASSINFSDSEYNNVGHTNKVQQNNLASVVGQGRSNNKFTDLGYTGQSAIESLSSQSIASIELPAVDLIISPQLEKAFPRYPMLAKLEKKVKPKSDKKVWVGLSMAGNFFDPNYANAPNSALNNLSKPFSGKGGQTMVYTANIDSWNDDKSALPALNLQIDGMFQLHNRWYLATSVGYGSYRSGSLMGVFTDVDGQRYPLHYANFEYNKLETASSNSRSALPVEAVSKFNFLQIPFKLNYVLIDKQFGVAPVLGINTQVFLNGRLESTNNNFVDEFEFDNDKSSPFRRLYFSGLVGAQFFYNAPNGTVVTLEPTYQQAVTPLNKDSYLFTSEPTNVGISLGLRKRLK